MTVLGAGTPAAMDRPSNAAPAIADTPTSARGPLAVFVSSAGAGVVLSAVVASGRPILASRWSLLGTLSAWATVWVIAVASARRLPARAGLLLVLVAALALRIAALSGPPTTSDDLYRYAWDGRVQAAGIDPYRSPPAEASLARLHEAWLWPDPAGCAALDRPPGCTRINRPAVRTIYPPVAEVWFAGISHLGGIGAHHKSWQLAGLATDVATIGLLVVALRRRGLDARLVALYALCPAPVLEFVNNAHVDGLALAFVVGALVVGLGPSTRRTAWRDLAVGALIGAAALVKLYPALLLVAVLGLPRPHPWRSMARATGAAVALAAVGYAPHVVAVGIRVVGYLPGYLKEEHYTKGGRFLLAGALGLTGAPAEVAAAVTLVAAVAWVASRRPELTRGAAVLLASLFLVATPVQPWYAISLLAVATVAGLPEAAVVVAAGYPYFFAVILDHPHTTAIGRLSYGTALAVVAGGAIVPRRRATPRSTAVHASPTTAAVAATSGPPRGSRIRAR